MAVPESVLLMRRAWHAPRAWTAASAACALTAAVVAGTARHVVFNLAPEDHARSIARFASGLGEIEVDPLAPWAELPWILPGPGDAWAGGVGHALTLPLGRRPLRALVLYIELDEPRMLQSRASLVRREGALGPGRPAGPDRLVVAVNGLPVAERHPRAAAGRPSAGTGANTGRRHRIAIPARALGDGSSVRLSLLNQSGPGIALERLRLVEATPTFSWRPWRRRGRFPPESAALLAASVGLLGAWHVARLAAEPRWRRMAGATAGAVSLGFLCAASTLPATVTLVADVPRWQWLPVPWVLLLLVGPRGEVAGKPPVPLAARARGMLVNTALGLAALAVSLLAAEYALRYAFRDVSSAADTRTYLHRPVVDRVNSLGFREREVPRDKPKDTYRIAVIGDSLTMGGGVLDGERFSDLLEARLNARRRSDLTYQVLNFGRVGWDTDHELEGLRTLVLKASPDFVLLQWYVNDFENGDYGDRPHPALLTPWDSVNTLLRARSALYSTLQAQWVTVQEKLGWVDTYADYLYWRFGDPDGPGSTHAITGIREFIEECQDHGIPMSIVLFPHVDADLSAGRYRFSYLHDRVLDACRREGATCVDLRSTFAAYPAYRTLWVSRLDPHPSALAHRLAADRLMEVWGGFWFQGTTAERVVRR
jgi:GDSL-like Lipase/Acylhydrolase family